jgi:hypothetical protein
VSPSDKAAFVGQVNSELAAHLARARRTLVGAEVFDVNEVRQIVFLVSRMEPHVKSIRQSRFRTTPELDSQINAYRQQLQELNQTLEQIRMMLLAKRGELELSRRHMSAVTRWTHAYQQTR